MDNADKIAPRHFMEYDWNKKVINDIHELALLKCHIIDSIAKVEA